uniref:Uncharacterized protein n=1 Tax=Erpetoichthys calabaricus TaxID=27687 RepID=A0A8C4XDK5_ERPCA
MSGRVGDLSPRQEEALAQVGPPKVSTIESRLTRTPNSRSPFCSLWLSMADTRYGETTAGKARTTGWLKFTAGMGCSSFSTPCEFGVGGSAAW